MFKVSSAMRAILETSHEFSHRVESLQVIFCANSLLQTAPKPKSLLGYHRILAPTAGVRVSPLCLGAMNFGESQF